MKDIRSLFESARNSGRAADVSAYVEAVDQLLESNPRDFISNVEYIISSGYGAQKFPTFVEKYGLPIAAYSPVVESLEHIIEKGSLFGKPIGDQEHLLGYLESYKAKYPNCFMMYEWFLDESADMRKYIDMYYSVTEAGQQLNQIIAAGSTNGSYTKTLMKCFGNVAIPDLLIESTRHGDIGIDTVFCFLAESFKDNPFMNQWLLEVSKDIMSENYVAPYMSGIMDGSLQNIVEACRSRNVNIYRESKLMGNDEAMLEYYPHELKAIEDYISFKEYQLLFLDESSDQIKCFNEIMSLYEELDGLIPEDATCFGEAMNPKNQTLKEIADRLNQLAKQAAKAVRAEFDNNSVFTKENIPYSVSAIYGTKKGPGIGFGGIQKMVKKNMSDISDFNEEWMDNIFLFITFHINVKRGTIKNAFSKVNPKVVSALRHLIDDGKIRAFSNFDARPTDEYSCWIAFKVSKTYAVGDSDIGMFESVAQIEEQVADQIIPMMALPNGQVVESKVLFNTTNKKTGSMPGYIAQNHDLDWGEREEDEKRKRSSSSSDSEESETEPTLDDFRRPSAGGTSDDDTSAAEPEDTTPATKEDDQRAINNYYYYTYNNSLNKNLHSFNKTQKDDHSTSDDHSVRTRADDHSFRSRDDHSFISKTDDHSTGKGSIPDDVDGGKPADKPVDKSKSDYTDPDEEYKSYGEAAQGFRSTQAWDKECRSFKSLFDLDLNKLGDVKSPDKQISITIGAHKFTFNSSLGNVPGKEEKLSSYTQVPTAVHQFNVHKNRICSDKIGLDRCLLHYLKLRDSDFDPDMKIDAAIKKYGIKSKNIVFNLYGEIGLTFTSNLNDGKVFAILINEDLGCKDGDKDIIFTEAVGDADDMKPKSDHPIKDTFQDIDRETIKYQQKAKKKVQDAQNVGRAIMKPVNRTKQWITKMVIDWKDKDENAMKEKMADPHARSNLFGAIKWCIKYGALAKAGLLFNPVFLSLSLFNLKNKKSKEFRIRNEMIGEIKTELAIIDEKIKDADAKGDNKAKYKLMRFKNEINKKLLRVGGTKEFKKII